MQTYEPDFIGNAGTGANTIAIMALNPDTEDYTWFKVLYGVDNNYYTYVRFTPDGTKVLVSGNFDWKLSLIYLDATDGTQLSAIDLNGGNP